MGPSVCGTLMSKRPFSQVEFTTSGLPVIAAAIGAAAAVIMEQGCTHKHYLKANGIKVDTIEVSKSTKIK